MPNLRVLKAENPGTFTLGGTRTHIVGRARVAVVDPGPPDERHLSALLDALEGADTIHILVTHHHADHAGAAPELARRLGVPFVGPGAEGEHPLREGERWDTDAGVLVAVATPGHSRDHVVFHWPEEDAVFVGDAILGEGETTWVGEYPGCVADYLASLERIRELRPAVLHPAHGPPIHDAEARIALFRRHREARIRQVEALLAERPRADAEELVGLVYGDRLPPGLEGAALRSVEVILHHLRGTRHDEPAGGSPEGEEG